MGKITCTTWKLTKTGYNCIYYDKQWWIEIRALGTLVLLVNENDENKFLLRRGKEVFALSNYDLKKIKSFRENLEKTMIAVRGQENG